MPENKDDERRLATLIAADRWWVENGSPRGDSGAWVGSLPDWQRDRHFLLEVIKELRKKERVMTKPTPGPWFFHDYSDVYPRGLPAPGDIMISCDHITEITVAFMGRALTGSMDEARANAALIAAAPDLHAALNYVANNIYCGADAEWHFKPGYDPQIVLDALAKARGEP